MLGLGLGLGLMMGAGGGSAPPVMVARNGVVLLGPGQGGAALLTGDGTEKTYTIDFQNVSGAPMTDLSLVNTGWQVQADGGGSQKINVGNDITLTSATVEYPIGGGSPASMSVGTITNGGLLEGDAAAVTTAIPDGATARLTMKATPPNLAKYSVNFGLVGIRTHAMNNTLRPCAYMCGDSIVTNDNGYARDAANDCFPLMQQSVIGNKLQRAASMAADYAAVAAANDATFFCLWGANDIASRTDAQMLADMNTLASACAAEGVTFYAQTLTPQVTSPGGTYASGDQVVTAGEPVRLAYNAGVRTAGGAIKVFELADALETARDSGFWKYGSADNFHLTDSQTITASSVTSTTVMTCSDMTLPAAATSSASIVGLTGVNAGVTRTVSSTSGTQVTSSAWPTIPGIGDTFSIRPIVNKSTADGLHLMAPLSGGLQFGGFYIARDAFRSLWLSVIAAQGGVSPYAIWGAVETSAPLSATTTSASVPYPLNTRVGDTCIIIAETANQPVAAPTGWTEARAPQGLGTAGAALAASVQIFVKDTLYAVGDAAPTISAGGGNHALYRMMTIRRSKAGAAAVNVSAGANDTSGTTTVTWPSVDTTQDGTLTLCIGADETDVATARVSAGANDNLLFFAERVDGGTTTANGGGLFVFSGTKSAAGATGATTCTSTVTTDKPLLTIAFAKAA